MSDYNSLCRACLASMESFQYYLFDNVLPNTYWFCTSIEVKQEEAMSKAICNKCYDLLTRFTEFKNTCIHSHNVLSSEIKPSNLLIDSQKSNKFESLWIKQESVEDNHLDNSNCKSNSSLVEVSILKYDLEDDNEIGLPESVDSDHETTNFDDPLKQSRKIKTRKRSKLKLIDNGKKFACVICKRRFLSPKKLKTHILTHEVKAKETDIETHQENRECQCSCEYCGKKFSKKKSLSSHVLRCHSGRQFICQTCNYPFADKYNLTQHLLIHAGKKLYNCKVCDKSFATRFSFEEHQRIHSGERPFSCSYCQKSFLSKKRLTEHIRTHTGEKPYKCSVCDRGFTQRGTVKRHMKIHDKIIPVINGKYIENGVTKS